jgi:glucose/arabinose dehydrogenase
VRRTHLLLFIAAPLAVSLGAFAACSSSRELSPPTIGPSADGAGDAPVAPDAPVIPDPAKPTCTTVDIAPGTGAKFCELPGSDVPDLQVPPEFCIREFTTTPVKEARVIRFAPNGDLFVAAPSMQTPGGAVDGPGSIIVLPDDNGDGKADSTLTYAGPFTRNGKDCTTLEADPKNLSCVHGLVFSGGYLYFTRSDEVRRVPYKAGDRAAPAATGELVATLGAAALLDAGGGYDIRWTHGLEQTKDGSLYVSRGRMDSSACSPDEMNKGAVFALHVETKAALPLAPELVADGFRNPMYLRCSPASCGECYASELTGDNWDGVGGKEKIALLATNGESWGFPCCVGRGAPAPGFGPENCGSVGREQVAIPIHDTNFGLDFERGGFPEPYKHGLFVALHGVVTSFGGTGVVFVKADPVSLRPTGAPTMFVKGFGKPFGRATDVTFAPDGRLFIADDTSGRIFWVAPRTLAAPKK